MYPLTQTIQNSINKVRMYKNQEQSCLTTLNDLYSDINCNYDSNNSENIYNLCYLLKNKFDIIIKNHDNYITVLEKNLNKYRQNKKVVEDIFDDII